MKRTFAMLVALLALGPAGLAGEAPGKDEAPAAADETPAPEPPKSSDDLSDLESGFSIPAADSESKEKGKK